MHCLRLPNASQVFRWEALAVALRDTRWPRVAERPSTTYALAGQSHEANPLRSRHGQQQTLIAWLLGERGLELFDRRDGDPADAKDRLALVQIVLGGDAVRVDLRDQHAAAMVRLQLLGCFGVHFSDFK